MLQPNKKALFQKLGNEAVILHMESEQYFGLDEVGTRIWEELSKKKDIEAILPTLLQEFEVESTVLRKDITELIAQLKAENLLQDA